MIGGNPRHSHRLVNAKRRRTLAPQTNLKPTVDESNLFTDSLKKSRGKLLEGQASSMLRRPTAAREVSPRLAFNMKESGEMRRPLATYLALLEAIFIGHSVASAGLTLCTRRSPFGALLSTLSPLHQTRRHPHPPPPN